jgi:GNAT superfamily N-acetyltransferase
MTTSATGTYRRLIKLPDGARLLLRPLTVDDRAALLDLYTAAEPADLHSLRHDVTDPEVVNSWLDDLDYQRVFPLLAIINDRVVGNATLHRPGGPFRHIGELRIFLAKDFRRRGLGTEMLQTLVELARKRYLPANRRSSGPLSRWASNASAYWRITSCGPTARPRILSCCSCGCWTAWGNFRHSGVQSINLTQHRIGVACEQMGKGRRSRRT